MTTQKNKECDNIIVKDGVKMIMNPLTNRLIRMDPPSATFLKLKIDCEQSKKDLKKPKINTKQNTLIIEFHKVYKEMKEIERKYKANPIMKLQKEQLNKKKPEFIKTNIDIIIKLSIEYYDKYDWLVKKNDWTQNPIKGINIGKKNIVLKPFELFDKVEQYIK